MLRRPVIIKLGPTFQCPKLVLEIGLTRDSLRFHYEDIVAALSSCTENIGFKNIHAKAYTPILKTSVPFNYKHELYSKYSQATDSVLFDKNWNVHDITEEMKYNYDPSAPVTYENVELHNLMKAKQEKEKGDQDVPMEAN